MATHIDSANLKVIRAQETSRCHRGALGQLSRCPPVHGLSGTAYTFIEFLQPYYPRNRYRFLHVLVELSNIDKHRHLNTTGSMVRRQERLIRANGSSGLVIQSGLDHGATLEPLNNLPEVMPDAVDVERQLFADVAFDEPEIRPNRNVPTPMQEALKSLIQELRFSVIPTFQGLLRQP